MSTHPFTPAKATQLSLATTLGTDDTLNQGYETNEIAPTLPGEEVDNRWRLNGQSAEGRVELKHSASREVVLLFGADATLSRYHIKVPANEDGRLAPGIDRVAGSYAELTYQPNRSTSLVPGIRVDAYGSQNGVKLAVEPRVFARLDATPSLSFTHAFGVAHQAPGFVVLSPGVPNTRVQGPLQTAIQHSAGVETDTFLDSRCSLTLFQTVFFNLTDPLAVRLRDTTQGGSVGAGPTPPPEQTSPVDLERTRGHSVGMELLWFRPMRSGLGGFVSYTLSRATRSYPDGVVPAPYDRTHVLQVAPSVELGKSWIAGVRYVFYTGFPAQITDDTSFERIPRAPGTHRLDARVKNAGAGRPRGVGGPQFWR